MDKDRRRKVCCSCIRLRVPDWANVPDVQDDPEDSVRREEVPDLNFKPANAASSTSSTVIFNFPKREQ